MLKITFFAIIYFIFILIYEVRNIKKQRTHHNILHWFIKIAFYIYIIFLIHVTFFPIPFQKSELDHLKSNFGKGSNINMIPLKSITHIIKSDLATSVKFRQIAGNLVLLLPLAFYLPLAAKKFRAAKNVFLFLLCSACTIEILQFLIGKIIGYNYRVVDLDDVILNVCGGMLGFLFWKLTIDNGKIMSYNEDNSNFITG